MTPKSLAPMIISSELHVQRTERPTTVDPGTFSAETAWKVFFWHTADMPGTAEVDRYRTDSGLWVTA
jgi:hypothetical protein